MNLRELFSFFNAEFSSAKEEFFSYQKNLFPK